MHVLLDIDGVLQFESTNFADRLSQKLQWQGDYQKFRTALFQNQQYHQSLRGKMDFLSVLDQLLRIHQPNLQPKDYLQWWLSDFTLNYELLSRLAQLRTDSLSLASNQERWRGDQITNVYAQHTCINRIYLSHTIGYRKPELEYFKYILNDLNASPKEVVFVDDMLENVSAARSIGIIAIHYKNNSQLLTALAQLDLLTDS
jgi:putative hydrolase of the HAD superfamily